MNNTIPCKAGIIDNNVDLAIAEISCLLHQIGDIVAVKDVADNSEGAAGFRRVDGVCDGVGLL